MKFLTPLSTLFLSLVVSTSAQAAKFEEVSELKRLDLVASLVQSFCESVVESNLDCGFHSYKIVSKKPSEPIANSIKQIIRSREYVDSASGELLSKSEGAAEIFNQLESVLEEAGFDKYSSEEAYMAQDDLFERFSNDIDNDNFVYVGGGISGPFSGNYAYIAIIDTTSGEVVIFYSGYSE